MMAGILLVLRGMHTGIVCDNDNHTGIDTGVRNGEQRIRCYVQANVLHAAEAALACQTGAECDFHGYLLIRCPFAVHLIIFCGFFGYLGTRCARVAGNDRAACFIQTAGNCLVAQHKLFHKLGSFLCIYLERGNKNFPSYLSSSSFAICSVMLRSTPVPPDSMRLTRLMVALLAPVHPRISL